MGSSKHLIGIYEKALPDSFSWTERLTAVKEAGFDYIEMSIDESDWRLKRLDWSPNKRAELISNIQSSGIPILSVCLSAHRRFPLGSGDPKIRDQSLEILKKAIDLSVAANIKIILVPGYDVFYEESTPATEERFIDGLYKAANLAEGAEILLALENTDKYITSIQHAKSIIDKLKSPWFQLYGDIGNLVAAGHDLFQELDSANGMLAGIHIKDAQPGVMRNVPLGEGIVPFKKLFQKLENIKFHGPLMLEIWDTPDHDPVTRIKAAREWIQSQMNNSLGLEE
jgi:L-ribulose-5-phosphate 3-epimerase